MSFEVSDTLINNFMEALQNRVSEMSRKIVNGGYQGENYILTSEGEDFLKIEPNTVIRVGNSIGGYFARQINHRGQKRIVLIRVSGSEALQDIGELKILTHGQKGLLLLPGMKGLWATSSGSAKRGLLHRITGEDNPVKSALRGLGLPSSLMRQVQTITPVVSEWAKSYHFTPQSPQSFYVRTAVGWFETDQKTYRILTEKQYFLNGGESHNLCWVEVTPDADLADVAQKVTLYRKLGSSEFDRLRYAAQAMYNEENRGTIGSFEKFITFLKGKFSDEVVLCAVTGLYFSSDPRLLWQRSHVDFMIRAGYPPKAILAAASHTGKELTVAEWLSSSL